MPLIIRGHEKVKKPVSIDRIHVQVKATVDQNINKLFFLFPGDAAF
jgi:hypothetical protein